MDAIFANKIRDYVTRSQKRLIPCAPATEMEIVRAERALGFPMPEALKSLYLFIGNGGFGPGRGGRIIGLAGGYCTSAGDLVATYSEMRRGGEYLGINWPDMLLPFCEWGCNIFTCDDCSNPGERIYLSRDCDACPQNYDLVGFLKMWLAGVDLLDAAPALRITASIVNPFTGDNSKVTERERKK